MYPLFKNKIFMGALIIISFFLFYLFWQTYVPRSFVTTPGEIYTIQKGSGASAVADELADKRIIKSQSFFKTYVKLIGAQKKLQAGPYTLSPSMSVAQIVRILVSGDIAKQSIAIIEGWNVSDIKQYITDNHFFDAKEVDTALTHDFSGEFTFLQERLKKSSLEGYVFPDTYFVPVDAAALDFVRMALSNFDAKLSADLRAEITKQKKSIFQIITMASMIEKEVRSLEDKKIVAGILWKRLGISMPLQVDATVDYATKHSDPGYDTYAYYGLPKGPISNPGLDSILAAIYPTQSPYWYYLSEPKEGVTIFSKTLEEHNIAVAKHLR